MKGQGRLVPSIAVLRHVRSVITGHRETVTTLTTRIAHVMRGAY